MVKRLIILVAVFGGITVSVAQITNVAQCIDTVLTPSVLSEISLTDCSTPQKSVLGFIKGSIEGDYKSFLLHFVDDARVEECGTANLSEITAEMTNSFYTMVQEFGFSNHIIRAYSESATGLIWHASVTLQSQKGPMKKTSYMETRLINTNGEWRISSWDVDE